MILSYCTYTGRQKEEEVKYLVESAERHGIEEVRFCSVHSTDSHRNADKIRGYLEALSDYGSDDVVFLVDCRDVILCGTERELVDRFCEQGVDVLVSAERWYSHQRQDLRAFYDTEYAGHTHRYINSGTIAGRAGHLITFLQQVENFRMEVMPEERRSDQRVMGAFIATHGQSLSYTLSLDVRSALFYVPTDEWDQVAERVRSGGYRDLRGLSSRPLVFHCPWKSHKGWLLDLVLEAIPRDALTRVGQSKLVPFAPGRIPSVAHLIWVGEGAPRPDYVDTNLLAWKRLMPDWEVRLWTDEDVPHHIADMVGRAATGAQKADILRYWVVWEHGGVYLDADITPRTPLAGWIPFDASLVVCHDLEITWPYIINSFFAATPHHPVLAKACALLRGVTLNTPDIHLHTGPRLWGRAVLSSVAESDRAYILPSKTLYRNDEAAEKVLGCHQFAATWVVKR